MKKKGLELVFVGGAIGDYLTAQIYFDGDPFLEINREKGVDRMELELLCTHEAYVNMQIKFSLDEFIGYLQYAREELSKLPTPDWLK